MILNFCFFLCIFLHSLHFSPFLRVHIAPPFCVLKKTPDLDIPCSIRRRPAPRHSPTAVPHPGALHPSPQVASAAPSPVCAWGWPRPSPPPARCAGSRCTRGGPWCSRDLIRRQKYGFIVQRKSVSNELQGIRFIFVLVSWHNCCGGGATA